MSLMSESGCEREELEILSWIEQEQQFLILIEFIFILRNGLSWLFAQIQHITYGCPETYSLEGPLETHDIGG